MINFDKAGICLIEGDCIEKMKELPDGCIDLVVTSPPYNVGKKYNSYNDSLPEDEYWDFTEKWISGLKRIVKKGGRICINIPIMGNNPEVKKKDKYLFYLPEYLGIIKTYFLLRECITWVKSWVENDANISCVGGNTAWGSWKSPSSPYCRSVSEFIIVCHKEVPTLQYKGETDLTKDEFLRYCYDEKTEILTECGWKRFDDVLYDDKIATLNSKKDVLEYQHPLDIIKENYSGKMYKLKSREVDLLVTPNHRLYVSIGQHNYNYKNVPAIDCFHKFILFKKNVNNWQGEELRFITIPRVIKYHYVSKTKKESIAVGEKKVPIGLWVKFFGFWLAEGHTSIGVYKYHVGLTNNNDNLLKEMRHILKKMGFKSAIYKNQLICCSKQLTCYLLQFGKCYEKFIPLEVKQLPSNYLKLLLRYFALGDGTIDKQGKICSLVSSSKQLMDDFQELLLKIGLSGNISEAGYIGLRSKIQNRVIVQKHNHYLLRIVYKMNNPRVYYNCPSGKNNIEQFVFYEGKVFCVSVPNEIIYVRRNGVPVWCGNTKNVWFLPSEHDRNHPAPFPKELPRRCIQLYSWIDATVLDPFMGSGTTGVVCKEIGRKFVGVEMDKQYFTRAKGRILSTTKPML